MRSGLLHQPGLHMVGHGPTDNGAGDTDPSPVPDTASRRGIDIGDVGQPFFVGLAGREVLGQSLGATKTLPVGAGGHGALAAQGLLPARPYAPASKRATRLRPNSNPLLTSVQHEYVGCRRSGGWLHARDGSQPNKVTLACWRLARRTVAPVT